MKVIVELEIENCNDCPYFKYEGTSFSEDVYSCRKTKSEVNGDGIPNDCPFIESTMNKLRQISAINKFDDDYKKYRGIDDDALDMNPS